MTVGAEEKLLEPRIDGMTAERWLPAGKPVLGIVPAAVWELGANPAQG